MARGGVDEGLVGSTGLDHVAVTERERLGTLALDLTTDGDFAALGARLHHVADDVGSGTAHLKVGEQLEAKRLHLGHSGETTGLYTVHEDVEGAILVAETLSDASADLTNALVLLSEHLTALGDLDSELRAKTGHTRLNPGKAFLSELTLKELKHLGILHTIADDRALLGEGTHDASMKSIVKKKGKNKKKRQRENRKQTILK